VSDAANIGLHAPVTIRSALAECRAALAKAGVESAALDARLLVAAALAVPVEQVVAWPERKIVPAAQARLAAMLARRAAREPMAHILGRREFWSLDFAVTSDVLIPRPDSETLVTAVLGQIADRTARLRLLDLGVGSGCLLLALLSELPHATGLGIDCSAAALAVAQRNATALGLASRAQFARGNWLEGVEGPFDVVISNPPYITRAELPTLAPDVRYEPRAALDGGGDGLDAYRIIAAGMPAVLAPGGFVVIEIGAGQAEFVTAILRQAGLEPWLECPDLSGTTRCLLARRPR
jgi:release factor glutamine methyltransferase